MGQVRSVADRLIVALDAENADSALELAACLEGVVRVVKVGSILYTASGPSIVRQLQDRGFSVMLDLKFHDIPSTVEGSCRAAASLGVSLLTVHAAGGTMMLEAAARGAAHSTPSPEVLAVTVLTSEGNISPDEVEQRILEFAKTASDAGCAGIVCSAREAAAVRRKLGGDPIIVCPGIRPASSQVNDQQRIATPSEAIQAGADYLVVGRPITKSSDPRQAAANIITEMESVH